MLPRLKFFLATIMQKAKICIERKLPEAFYDNKMKCFKKLR
jgi:hypothetical protein